MKPDQIRKIWDRSLAQRIDQSSIQSHAVSGSALMEEAGTVVARYVRGLCNTKSFRAILAVAGPGNNGGDTLVAARLLADAGLPVVAILVNHTHATSSCQNQVAMLPAGIKQLPYSPDCVAEYADKPVLIIDGILGLGFAGELRPGPLQTALDDLSRLPNRTVVAVDLPSGMDADRWDLTPRLKADMTVTFGEAKPCHKVSPSRDYCGQVQIEALGFAPQAIAESLAQPQREGLWWVNHFSDDPWSRLPASAHKFDRGHVLVVGGSKGKIGAPILSALAALKTGAGWVSVAAPPTLVGRYTNLPLTLTFESFFDGTHVDENALAKFLNDRQVKSVVLGPGTVRQILSPSVMAVLQDWQQSTQGFTVIDAGCTAGLWSLLQLGEWLPHLTLLTPHPGEWRKLGGALPPTILSLDDTEKVLASDWCARATLVYKSATPLVFGPDRRVTGTDAGNRWLGKAGSGDVIAGCAAAFGCLKLTADEAFMRAMEYTGDAAILCSQRQKGDSIIATDLIDHLGRYP